MLLIPVGTSLECQRIPENKGAVLKDAAHRGRIDELDGFALGFFCFCWFFRGEFILNKHLSQSRTKPNPSSSTTLGVGEAHGCDHSLVRLFIPFADSCKNHGTKGISKWVLRRGCSAPSQRQASAKIWLF